jgi:hypothetical protein
VYAGYWYGITCSSPLAVQEQNSTHQPWLYSLSELLLPLFAVRQVSGRQQLLLVAPEQAFSGCYPFPAAHPYDRYSCVDWEEPELQHWPAAAQVRRREATA